MNTVERLEGKVQAVDARVRGAVQVASAVLATGTGVRECVREFVFANWEVLGPVMEGSAVGRVGVAFLVTLVSFLMSVWLCARAGVFSKGVEVVGGKGEPRKRLGQAARERRERRVLLL